MIREKERRAQPSNQARQPCLDDMSTIVALRRLSVQASPTTADVFTVQVDSSGREYKAYA